MKRITYAIAFAILLAVEFAIALWARGPVRGFVGDLLVVVLIYCFVQAIFLFRPAACALGVLLFAFLIEGLQALDYAAWLGVDDVRWASILLGRTFSWLDLVAYGAGCALLRLDPRW